MAARMGAAPGRSVIGDRATRDFTFSYSLDLELTIRRGG